MDTDGHLRTSPNGGQNGGQNPTSITGGIIMSTKPRNIYTDALAYYGGETITDEMRAALKRVQERRHDELVRQVADAIHEELMDARTDDM